MQHKLEELCQIETVLLLETVNVSYLSQEHQVCVYEKNVGQHVWWYFILYLLFSQNCALYLNLFSLLILGCSGKVKGCSKEKFTGRWK